jgi:hypothetical protein
MKCEVSIDTIGDQPHLCEAKIQKDYALDPGLPSPRKHLLRDGSSMMLRIYLSMNPCRTCLSENKRLLELFHSAPRGGDISYLEWFAFKHIFRSPKLGRKSWTSGHAHQFGLDDVLAEVAFDDERYEISMQEGSGKYMEATYSRLRSCGCQTRGSVASHNTVAIPSYILVVSLDITICKHMPQPALVVCYSRKDSRSLQGGREGNAHPTFQSYRQGLSKKDSPCPHSINPIRI